LGLNSTQKRVDKSLTYELFGYNISEEKEEYWTPDKLAVFLTRKLNTEENSPLSGRILIAPTRLIRSNIPTRIALTVQKSSESKIILDVTGAEDLLGRGDMLIKRLGDQQPVRGHGVFITRNDIEAYLERVR
jgi:hypothetical protein